MKETGDLPHKIATLYCTTGLQAKSQILELLSQIHDNALGNLILQFENCSDFDEGWEVLTELVQKLSQPGFSNKTDVGVENRRERTWSPPEGLPQEIVEQFFAEADLFVTELMSILPEAEVDSLQEVYRILHTLKGNAGMMGLSELQDVLHQMESQIQNCIHSGRIDADTKAVLLNKLRVVETMLKAAREGRVVVPESIAEKRQNRNAKSEDVSEGRSIESNSEAKSSQDYTCRRPGPTLRTAEQKSRDYKSTTKAISTQRPVAVSPSQIERLSALAGEALIKQTRLKQKLEQIPEEMTPEGMDRDILEGELVVRSLQRELVELRLVPLERLFQKHKMTVYQTARLLDKKVRLQIESTDAKLDRAMVEELDELLLHLIRNAISHGIQKPQERIKAGKPEEGVVTLRAKQEGSRVIIEVCDDGIGISADKIRKLAVKKGYLTEEEARQLSDSQAIDLIFAPGFSTSLKTDKVSGRGVGLDVVKDRIERMHGSIVVDTQVGKGTCFRLSLPVTLALRHVIFVELADQIVAIPIDNVEQTVEVHVSEIIKSGSNLPPHYMFESSPIPLIFLSEHLGLAGKVIVNNACAGVIIIHGKHRLCAIVDRVLDQAEVIVKEIPEYITTTELAAGVTLRADKVVFLVDVPALHAEFYAWQPEQRWYKSTVQNIAIVCDKGMSESIEPLINYLRVNNAGVWVFTDLSRIDTQLCKFDVSLICISQHLALQHELERLASLFKETELVAWNPTKPHLDTRALVKQLYKANVSEWFNQTEWQEVARYIVQRLRDKE